MKGIESKNPMACAGRSRWSRLDRELGGTVRTVGTVLTRLRYAAWMRDESAERGRCTRGRA